jgi:arginyl-tRNA synthetase
MDAEGTILYALKNALAKLGIHVSEVQLTHPEELSHGDYATSVALAGAKEANKSPKALAEEIVEAMGTVDGVSKIEVAGPGFINFTLSRGYFPSQLKRILDAADRWGRNDHVKGYKVMVEYTDPNAFKPLHIGHLMSNAIGESLARLTEFSGADMKKANYASDIGLNVAKGVWGAKKIGAKLDDLAALGKAYAVAHESYETDPNAKEEIDAVNKALYENSDAELSEIRAKGVAASLKHLYEICDVLGTKFDFEFLESQSAPLGKEVVLKNTPGIFEVSEGATVYKGENEGLHTRVFLNARGLPTYEAKDIGLIGLKQKAFPFDLSIIVTSVEQKEYFKVVKAAAEKLFPELKGKLMHVPHGFLTLTTGKMSSRKGNVITGESLVEDMRAKALGKMEGRDLGEEKQGIADTVAVSAIKYAILRQTTGKNIIFDPEASLSFEGDSGPYLQYSHVRARAVLRKAEEEHVRASEENVPEETVPLERLLYRFPEVVFRAAKESEPHYVTTYLTELAASFNGWYAQGKIVDTTDPYSPYKVAITQAFATTMKNGLWLLGIQAPERM